MSPLHGDRPGAESGRVRRVVALTALLFLVLVGRLFTIQVIGATDYLRLSSDNRFRETRIPAPRGLILDRFGRVLATNQAACEARLAVRTRERSPRVIDELAEVLELPRTEILSRLDWGARQRRSRVALDRDLDKGKLLLLEERLPELPGLVLRDWARRVYPHGTLVAQLLGYVGEVGESEIARTREDRGDPRAYRSGDLIGRAGVEKSHEAQLRGTDGKELFLVDARGNQLETVRFEAPRPGNDLVLTLDLELCAALDSALASWGRGAGVVLNARTGEILAAASQPAFDPNLLAGGISEAVWADLSENAANPLFNRVMQANYAPGSTLKPFIALEALERGLVTPDQRFRPCAGGLQLGERYFKCWLETGHGSQNLVGAIETSCDVYFYQLGERLGLDGIASVSRRFGLGRVSAADLAAESPGLVPDVEWFDKRFGTGRWTTGNVWNVSIGQGEILVNCLQMARAYAALGNGGFLPVPRLRHHVADADGVLQIPFTPSRGDRIRVDATALEFVREGLVRVLHGDNGTARASGIASFVSAGKTGTVQNPHGLEHAWFCGYAPADDPQIAISIIVEHGEHGSDIGPMFRHLVAEWFELDVPPLRRSRREGE